MSDCQVTLARIYVVGGDATTDSVGRPHDTIIFHSQGAEMSNPRKAVSHPNHALDRLAIQVVSYVITIGVWLEAQLGLAPKKLIPLVVKTH
jgi:hypothetical protein